MNKKIRIVLCDDHPLVLGGLHNLILSQSDFEIVGEAKNGIAALKTIRDTQPDVAVLDMSMPELNGIALIRRVVDELPSTRLIVLTLHEDRAYVRQAMRAGARAYVLKRSAAETLIHAIRAALVGGIYVDPAVANFVIEHASVRDAGNGLPPSDLTHRETEVLRLAALGYTNKEIARRLDLGIKSVETYRSRGSEKLGIKSRAELVRFATAQGWFSQNSLN